MAYDVVVIGSGPGGYVAAIRAAQLGLKTALIEKYPSLGGTCLNVGCIPSKALLDSSEKFHEATHVFKTHGIECSGVGLDFGRMMARKAEVVDQTTKGIAMLMKGNKVDVFHGVGSFVDNQTVEVAKSDGAKERLTTKHVIVATGSKPSSLPDVTIDKKRVISSTEALMLEKVPGEMVVIGAGAIGLEMASVYARLGTKVTVVEYLDSAVPVMDRELGRETGRVLKKSLGIALLVSHRVQAVTNLGDRVEVKALDREGNEKTLLADYCLVAVGRKTYTEGLGLDRVGIVCDERGRIIVDESLRTTQKNVFAIGDVIRGAMLAHKAEEEGVFVAETIAGQKPHIDYRLIPGVVYTWPEIAAVGSSEEDLKKEGRAYKTGRFWFRASGRARASGDVDGFIKVLADEKSDEILGVHMIGPRAADMIGEAVVAMEFRAAAEDVGRACHAHPTYSEAFKEACLAATAGRAIHA